MMSHVATLMFHHTAWILITRKQKYHRTSILSSILASISVSLSTYNHPYLHMSIFIYLIFYIFLYQFLCLSFQLSKTEFLFKAGSFSSHSN